MSATLKSNSDYYITQGTDESLTVTKTTDFVAGDIIYLTVKEKIDGDAIIEKEVSTFVDGAAVINFTPEDTEGLETGTYFYGIQWYSTATGKTRDLIPASGSTCTFPKFIICYGVV